MKRKRHSPEQIMRKLREGDRMLSEGKTIAEACQQLEVVEATFHRWRNQSGGMKADDAGQLKALQMENARLKKLVADLTLDGQILVDGDGLRVRRGSSPAGHRRTRPSMFSHKIESPSSWRPSATLSSHPHCRSAARDRVRERVGTWANKLPAS